MESERHLQETYVAVPQAYDPVQHIRVAEDGPGAEEK